MNTVPVKIIAISLLLGTATIAWSNQQALTDDGRRVLLKDDGSWEYVRAGDEPAGQIRLSLEKVESLSQGCRLGLRLHNGHSIRIDSLVLHVSAFKPGPILYETVTRGFAFIKPTLSQYKPVMFRGIQCNEIEHVEVEPARNCSIGELTKYSEDRSLCSRLVTVETSDQLTILKR